MRKCLEFQGIARGIANEKGGLLAGLAFEPKPRLKRETHIGGTQLRRQFPPFRHLQDHAKMPHRHILSVNPIMGFRPRLRGA